MLFTISPAKALDYESKPSVSKYSMPLFVKESAALIAILKKKTPAQIASLMHLSDNLASLNVARYQAWSENVSTENAKQALLAFDGDVYGGLDAKTLVAKDMDWAQEHLCILSGLYGVLRPLDLMQPYRLEMGTPLKTRRGASLYAYWDKTVATYLNERLAAQNGDKILVNLASQEYSKVVNAKALDAKIIECVFQDEKSGTYKVISFFAKRARGLMMRYAIENRIEAPEALKEFKAEGYQFVAKESKENRYVFRRKEKQAK